MHDPFGLSFPLSSFPFPRVLSSHATWANLQPSRHSEVVVKPLLSRLMRLRLLNMLLRQPLRECWTGLQRTRLDHS